MSLLVINFFDFNFYPKAILPPEKPPDFEDVKFIELDC